jgi:hypothetical protein
VEAVALGLVVAALVVLAVVMHTKAPCSTYSYTPVKNVPARCLAHFERR